MAILSTCCRASFDVAGGVEGTNYYQCLVCKKPCDISPPYQEEKEVRTGDEFKIGDWVFRVSGKENLGAKNEYLYAHKVENQNTLLKLPKSMYASLDWIKPPVKFTKEQVDAIKHFWAEECDSSNTLFKWLDEHLEK